MVIFNSYVKLPEGKQTLRFLAGFIQHPCHVWLTLGSSEFYPKNIPRFRRKASSADSADKEHGGPWEVQKEDQIRKPRWSFHVWDMVIYIMGFKQHTYWFVGRCLMDVYRFQWDLTTQNSDVVFCFHWISVGSNQQTWLIISWAFHQGAASYLASTGI